MKITGILLVSFLSISTTAYAVQHQSQGQSANTMVAVNGTTSTSPPTSTPPLKPYPRLLPLRLDTPTTAQAGIPIVGLSVSLQNPGDPTPNAHLRLFIHDKDSRQTGGRPALNPDNITVEVLEGGVWKPVLLGTVEGGVMGAIGAEGVAHRERYSRDGFAIPAGLDKTWQLRVTISRPGTYSVVVSVSPDFGSTHLAQPAHSTIVVQ